jgi:hypothetical protein
LTASLTEQSKLQESEHQIKIGALVLWQLAQRGIAWLTGPRSRRAFSQRDAHARWAERIDHNDGVSLCSLGAARLA